MWNTYFERRDREDRRRAEYARLDAALAATRYNRSQRAQRPTRGNLRVAMGHAMIRAGSWMAGDTSATPLSAQR